MSNFDLRKFLAEGKLYEEATSTEEAMKPSNKQKLIDAGYSKSDAEDFADEFEQGGVKIPQKVKDILSEKSSSKMTKSELKKKIRQEILAELTLAEDDVLDLDGGAETEGPDGENVSPVYEATKDGDGEVPSKDANTDIDIEDKEEVEVDVEKKPKMSTTDSEFLDQLEDLKDEADAMGDSKLERQVDNTITYFTRQHIAANESIELEEADDMDLVTYLETALAEGYSEFQRVAKGKKKTAAKNKAEEEVYGAGVKKGEEIEKAKVDEVESKELKVKEKVDVFNKGGKYQGWGRNEYLYNAEIVNIDGDKITVKDINDDEYEVDSLDVSKLDESITFPLWNKIK